MSDADITDRVVSTAERLEDYDDPQQMEPLEYKVVASLDGTIREVIAVLGTGGPHIEVNCTNGTVSGYWGGDSHTTHCNADSVLDYHEELAHQHWESVVA